MVGSFLRGFGHGLRGLGWMRSKPVLLRYWLPPVVLTVLVFVLLQATALRYFDALLAEVWAPPGGEAGCGDDSGLACWGLTGLYWLASAVSWLVAAALGAMATFVVSVVISAPFHDALSEATERLAGDHRPAAFSLVAVARDAARGIGFELLKWALFLALMGPLWLLSWLVPGLGQLIYLGVGGLLAAAFFSLDFTDWPASRRGWGVRRRFALLRQHPAAMLGFGASVSLLLFVPVLSALLVPAAVIGGTRLFLELTPAAEKA